MVSTLSGGVVGDPFEVGGIPQGDPISPMLWVLVCDCALSHGLTANTPTDKGYLLARSGTVPGKHRHIYAKVQGMQTIF